MVYSTLLILGPLWTHILTRACGGEELPREAVLSWFGERVLEGLGLEEPPRAAASGPDGGTAQPEARRAPRRAPRMSWEVRVDRETRPTQETAQIILFPSADSACARSDSAPGGTARSRFTYYFQPSVNRGTLVTSAHFWFYSGEGAAANSSSARLFILTSAQQLLQVASSAVRSDGWITYQLDKDPLASVAEGPFLLQVHCPACECHADEPDKTPFLHLRAQARGPVRSPRQGPVTIPWSPSAINLFQRPSQERPQLSDCHRAQIEISFEELGWDNWIVHPKVLTFYYCHGNCSALDRTTARLGIAKCCAPVPGSMKSLRITTTSDGGYSFKYETLPNIIPEECTCF